mgnify:CR=1 FL=1
MKRFFTFLILLFGAISGLMAVPEPPAILAVDDVTDQVTIAAIRNRLSINVNDFTDFAGLYVSKLPNIEDAEVNITELELKERFKEWEIQKFTRNRNCII